MKQKDLKIDFRYLTGNIACLSVDSISGESVHNDINNEEAIIIFNSLVGEKADCQTVKSLLKENQELKKQLEEYQKDIKDLDNQDLKELNQKFDSLLTMFSQLLGLNSQQIKAIRESGFDKTKQYQQQALDQRLANYQGY